MDSSLELVNSIKDRTKLRNIIVTSATDYSPEPSQPAQIAGIYQFRDLLGKYESEPPTVDIDVDEDLAELVFTGGTTGSPKGVMLTHANKVANVCHSAWALSAFEEQLKGQGTWLIGIPLFHQAGQQNMHFCIYWAFEIFLLPDARDIDMLLQLLKKHQPILCSCVPTQYAKLLAKGVGELNTFFTSTTAALPKEVASKFKEETGADIGEAYGMTEAGGGTHSNLSISPLIEVKKIGSIGVPFPDTEVEIIDLETGKEAASGKEGELWVRGPQIMKGYWPETGSGLVDGWLPTGDVVRMDEDGYFYITDRIKDMANVSGMKVYTILVDRVLYEHSAVAEAAAVGIPDPERPTSDRVKAFIRLKEEYEGKVTAEDIIRHCREKLPPYSVPKYVEFRKEFPLGPTGKILKRQLREEEITKSKEVVQ
jgi:long-chain acyl-CoA synthetase